MVSSLRESFPKIGILHLREIFGDKTIIYRLLDDDESEVKISGTNGHYEVPDTEAGSDHSGVSHRFVGIELL